MSKSPLMDYSNIDEDEPLINKKPNDEGYRPIVAFVFAVNFIVGAGVLGLPYGFAQGGIVTGVFFIACIVCFASISMGWLVEVQGRACGLKHLRIQRNSQIQSSIDVNDFAITHLDGEVNSLCILFLGETAGKIYNVSLFFFTFGALWVYTIVFASSMVNGLGITGMTDGQVCDLYGENSADDFNDDCNNAYMIYVLIFGCLMGFMSTRELTKQITFQMTLTAVAIFALLVMIGTVFDAWVAGDYYNEADRTVPKGDGPYSGEFDLFNASGLATLFGSAVFSQNAHHGAPGITRLCKDKRLVRGVFLAALCSTGLLYVMLSTITVVYFGSDNVKEIITLNWSDYSGGDGTDDNDISIWASGISYMVVLFPCVTVSCAFPLYAVTMGSSLCSVIPDHIRAKYSEKTLQYASRLFVALPPLILGLTIKDPAVVVNFTGMSGFVLMLLMPAALQYYSRELIAKEFGREHISTPYSTRFSSNPWVYFIFAFGIFGFGVTLVFTFLDLVG